MESPGGSETTRHICGHCQQEVLTVEGCRPFGIAGRSKWRLPLKHGPDAVGQAALSGCPFFVWLWDQLRGSQTPSKQMKRTTIVLEVEATTLKRTPVSNSSGATLSGPSIDISGQETHDITGCVVKVETNSYAWTAGSFNVMSDWDDPSANEAMARMVDGHTSSSQAIAQIRRRLQYCRTHHDACKATPNNIRPKRFISVGGCSAGVKVVSSSNFEDTLADDEPYAALSYCWGQDQSLKSTMANKLEMENSVPMQLLPKTIQDAIHLSRELHIKLLWVDSLCLVQDDEDELAREVAKMQHYYGNACITISAATPALCSAGFLQPEPMPLVSEDEILGPFYFPVDLGVSERQARVKLVTRRRPMEAIDSRAWTLQEGLLSHRLVSFGSRIVRWSCQTDSYGLYESNDLREAMRAFRSRMRSQQQAQWTWGDTKLWCTLVENYTARTLSNGKDRLPAISGIGSFICENAVRGDGRAFPAMRPVPSPPHFYGIGAVEYPSSSPPPSSVTWRSPPIELWGHVKYAKYAAGLLDISLLHGHITFYQPWHLMAQLLWVPLRKASREKTHGCDQSYVAPSWSWASHNGAVDMTVTKVDDGLLKNLISLRSALEFKVRRLRVVPANPEAPFGSLSKASLTLQCPISRDHEDKHIAFDDGTQHVADHDSGGGLIYLQIIPDVPDVPALEAKELTQLRGIPSGLVLRPAGHEGQDPANKKVWRRVGVYYTRWSGGKPGNSSPVGGRGESSRVARGLKTFRDVIRGDSASAQPAPSHHGYEITTII